MKYYLLLIVLLASAFSACEKEQDRSLLDAYFKFTVENQDVTLKDGTGLNNNTFECILRGDTALYIRASKMYQEVGFVIKDSYIKDGTYNLDSINTGYYNHPYDYRRYTTNNAYKGTLTIKRGTFKAKNMLNTLEGQFAFTGEDTARHKPIVISSGSFFMERQEK